MAVRGFGSLSSPIVISDDEEAASVERQLGGYAADWHTSSEGADQSDDPGRPNDMYSHGLEPMTGQKRKWNDMAQVAGLPHPPQFESKTSRKKKRKRQRLAAQSQGLPANFSPGPLLDHPALPHPIASSLPASRPVQPPGRPHPQKRHGSIIPHSETGGTVSLPEILPPFSWNTGSSINDTVPQSMPRIPSLPPSLPPRPAFTRPQFPSTSLAENMHVHRLPQLVSPVNTTSPVVPLPPSALSPPRYVDMVPTSAPILQPAAQTATVKKPIGMSRDLDLQGRHGLYPTASMPVAARTLVLELLPKKFRNVPFVQAWAKRFAHSRPVYVEVDSKVGKALIEFPSVAVAQNAFDSPRLSGEGREHIRAWWFRTSGLPKPSVTDLEEGEIEEGMVPEPTVEAPQTSKKKAKQKQKQKTPKKKRQEIAVPSAPLPALYQPKEQVDEDALLAELFRPRTQSVNQQSAYGAPFGAPPRPAASGSRYAPSRYLSNNPLSAPAIGGLPVADGQHSHTHSFYPIPLLSHTTPGLDVDEEQAMDLESDDGGYDPEYEPWEKATGIVDGMDYALRSIASSRSSQAGAAVDTSDERVKPPADARDILEVPLAAGSGAPPSRATAEASQRASASVKDPETSTRRTISSQISPERATRHTRELELLEHGEVSVVCTQEPQLDQQAPPKQLTTLAIPPEEMQQSIVATPPAISSPVERLVTKAPSKGPAAAPASLAVPLPSIPDPSRLPTVVAVPVVRPPVDHPVNGGNDGSTKPAAAGKRSLLERQKELEERIARVKEELSRRAAGNSNGAAQSPEPVSLPTHSSVGVTDGQSPSAMEELRRSALKSRNKPSSGVVSTAMVLAVSEPLRSDTGSTAGTAVVRVDNATGPISAPFNTSTASPSSPERVAFESSSDTPLADNSATPAVTSTPPPDNNATNLDELAISFITESIQTVQPTPHSPVPQPSTKSVPSLEKMFLAAKQKRLEQHIAESKILMSKLNAARTKGERDQILGILRERRRAMEEDMKPEQSPQPSPVPSPAPHQPVMQVWKTRWPETARDATILIISDDEDDEDD